jgi:hypothetical protein
MRRVLTLFAAATLALAMALPAAASTYYLPTANGQWAAYPGQSTTFGAAVQQPINIDGSSNFKSNGKAVIPVKFALSQGTGAFVFESIYSDNTTANDGGGVCGVGSGADRANDCAILQWQSKTTFTFNQLTTLIADYTFTLGDCYGGSLRWDVYVASVGVVRVYYGNPSGVPDPPGQSCTGASNESGQNLITTGPTNRFEVGNNNLYVDYATVQAAVGNEIVTGIQLTLDSGWHSDQLLTLSSATVGVGNGAATPYTDTWTPLPASPLTATCPTAVATITIDKVPVAASGNVNEPVTIQPQDNDGIFRIVDCKYMYNLATSSLSGVGTYTVYATIGSTTFTVATFDLK